MSEASEPEIVDRYAIYEEFASGGMAGVHFGLLLGPDRFSRAVAIKRLHPQFAKDPVFVAMFIEEARLASRVRHPSVVPMLDVVSSAGEVLLVMEYVPGVSLLRLLRVAASRGDPIPRSVVSAIFVGVLDGLHAAHEARDESDAPLHLVHRDVSPHNVLVGSDGVARVLDFGIAKAEGRLATTREGHLKGKLAYMAPERLKRDATRGSDIYSAGVCLWETLVLRRLFEGDNASVVLAKVAAAMVSPPSTCAPEIPEGLDALAMRALDRDPKKRFATAAEMARVLEACVPPAAASSVREWLLALAGEEIERRDARVVEIETASSARSFAQAPAPAAASAKSKTPLPHLRWRRALMVSLGALLGVGVMLSLGARRSAQSEDPIDSREPPTIAAVASSAPPPAPSPPEVASTPLAPATQSRAIKSPTPPPPRRSQTRPACDPPYTVDPDGMRHYKKECFPK